MRVIAVSAVLLLAPAFSAIAGGLSVSSAQKDGGAVEATDVRLTKVTILRPSAGTEVYANVQKLSWNNNSETFAVDVVTSIPERGLPVKATAVSIDRERGTYTARQAMTPAGLPRRAPRVQNNVGNCDPFVESTCSGGGGGGSETLGQYMEAVAVLNVNDVDLKTRAGLGVTPCRGSGYGTVRVDNVTGFCQYATGWSAQCVRSFTPAGSISSSASVLVTGTYTQGGAQAFNQAQVTSTGYGVLSASTQDFISTSYSSSSCGSNTDGGSGGPSEPGDPDAGGETYCAPVYDGETTQYLGHCCGTTSEAIIKCAMQYL